MEAVSPSNNLIKSLWPSEVPFAEYKSLIDFIRFLFDVPVARVLGIASIKESLNLFKKSKIVLSTSA